MHMDAYYVYDIVSQEEREGKKWVWGLKFNPPPKKKESSR
jgi:hypothetical protein